MNNKEVAKKIVDRIISIIDSGEPLPWVKPWNARPATVTVVDGVKTVTITPHAWNRRGTLYKGANNYLPGGEYITFTQAKAEGAQIAKGAHGFPVVYWNFQKKTETNPDTGEEEEIQIPILKYYIVFRVQDCIGKDGKPLAPKHTPEPRTIEIPVTHTEPIDGQTDLDAAAEDVIADYVSRAGNGFHVNRDRITDKAYYTPTGDFVTVPMRQQFSSISEYYSTLFHELAHSTGHRSRLARFTGAAAAAAFGSETYSREELVAEATAASVLNALNMEQANTFRNSAAYIKSWAAHIKNDPMMYVTAMTRAQAAFDMILGVPAE